MNIGSIGSCLSNMAVSHLLLRFGGKRSFHVYRHRSDQFYFYHIKKDRKIIPRDYIESNLILSKKLTNDPNFIPQSEMLDNQYNKIGKHGVTSNKDFFEVLKREKLDIIILDNYIDMGTQLSYPKVKGYEESPVFLRTGDYENYKNFFNLGDNISIEDSAFYFKEIISYIKNLQPTATIYFFHYPYNTYINNSKRQSRAKMFEQYFEYDDVTIVPAPTIRDAYQIQNDPAHYHDSIYVAYAGYIYFDYLTKKRIKLNKKLSEQVYWIEKHLNAGQSYSISGITKSNINERESAALIIFDFIEDEIDENTYKSIGLNKSSVGFFKYLPIKNEITEWSFLISLPENINIRKIGFRTWSNKFDVFIDTNIIISEKVG